MRGLSTTARPIEPPRPAGNRVRIGLSDLLPNGRGPKDLSNDRGALSACIAIGNKANSVSAGR